MEKDVKQRMQLVLSTYKTNCTQLANKYGVNQKSLNSHINGTTAVPLSTILLILEAFPDVSSEWLLRGSGNMNTNSQGDFLNATNVINDLLNQNKELREELRMKTDPEQPKKESEVYSLWMEHMKLCEQEMTLSERMHELYQNQKEG